MRLAVPCNDGQIAAHFGHAAQFGFFDVNADTGTVEKEEFLTPPGHEPGVLPRWLAEKGANVVLAGGMGGRAVGLLEQQGIKAVVGVVESDARKAVAAYVAGTLDSGSNACNH